MELKTFVTGVYKTNNYLVINNKQAVLIDASDDDNLAVDGYLSAHGIELTAVLFTHGHFDHIGLGKHYTNKGIPTYLHKNDRAMTDTGANLSYVANIDIPPFVPAHLLSGGERLNLAGLDIEVMHTPGHSTGAVSYILPEHKVIFSGDTLFYRCVGRTDLPGGNAQTLQNSVRALFALKGDYKVYPGHDRSTTLSKERQENPYVRWE